MMEPWKNPNPPQDDGAETALAQRKLDKSMMFYTTEARRQALQHAAKVLEGNGVDLEASGHTGIINDFLANDLRAYMARKLTAAGLTEAAVAYEIDKWERLTHDGIKRAEAGGKAERK